MSTDHAPALQRSIRLPHATALVAGTIIGASIFVQPSEITRHTPSIPGVLLVWTCSGILTLFGALVCAELASAFPKTGGVYVFLREAFSPALGFLWGWAMFWSMHSGIIAAIAVVFARYVGFFMTLDDVGIRAVAILAVLSLSAVNYVGVRQGSTLQALFTLGKVAAIALLIAAGFLLGGGVEREAAGGVVVREVDRSVLTSFVMALMAGLFAFGGWHMVTYSAEETVNPERTIPSALMLGILIVTLCYVALNAAYLYVLPLEAVISSTRVASDAADRLVGPGGAAAMSGLVIFSSYGALSGIVLAGPRVYYAMARDGLLFEWASRIHPRFRTPHWAILLQAVWSSVLIATGTYRQLVTRVIYTEWIFFGLMAAGLFLLRNRTGYSPAYRMWGYPLTPAVFILSSGAIVINQVLSDPRESLIGLILVAAGLPVYGLWLRRPSGRGAVEHVGHRLP